ncbi:MAG: adenylate/guanylate cyclase domain-containing protein [Verrucomicrobiota bacterium]
MKWKLAPRSVGLLITIAVFLAVLLARHHGVLQFLEFRAYDFFLRQRPTLSSGDPIVLVEMTEDDIQSPTLDYPLTDEKLAELLTVLAAQNPAVIGLDIWRDVPVPKSALHLQDLNRVLLTHSNIICIYTLGGVAPPVALQPFPDRLGFNDNFPVDSQVEKTTPKVRRSMLFTQAESGQQLDSLPYRVACVYLERHGIKTANSLTQLHALQANDGPYVGADTAGMQLLLDFQHPPDFARYSVGDALAGRIPPGSLRDKIVFVGMNALSVSDERVTPISYRHRGIEVQSVTILQLLRAALTGEQSLRFWPDWLEDAWMLGWCLLGGLIAFHVRSPWRFIAAIFLSLIALGFISFKSFQVGWWIPLLSPVVAFLPAAALVTSYISFQEHRNRGQLMKLFANQVSPDIAQALWEQRDEFLAGARPKSQKLTATVLFTDLKGFSTTSEGLEPADLMDWLNEYMEAMAKTVMANQGVVEKYIGDSVMALFGVPLPRTTQEQIAQDARNSVRCALAMGLEMERLNALWQQRGLPACSTRIGIHTGPLVAGSLGSAERQEYTVIGDSVNIASRLESHDKDSTDSNLVYDQYRILISEATQSLLADEFNLMPVGSMSLKGKSEKVTVYRVVAENSPTKKESL